MNQAIENYLSTHYDFRYNTITNRISYKLKEDTAFKLLNEIALNSLLREMEHNGIKCNLSNLRKILFSEFSEIYSPFKEYFDNLPTWTEESPDFIDQLANTVQTTNQEIWKSYFKKWLVAFVACAIDDKIVNQTAIVLSGIQGCGKTTWLNNLVPAQLYDYSYCGYLDTSNKDSSFQLSECLLINLDELASLTKSSLNRLKILITKDRIRSRRAYGYNIENYARRASFCGSVNGSQFLLDTTGNRRFLCFEVESIDLESKINLNNVYAQALALFKADYRFWFNQEEIDNINFTNKQFEQTSLEEQILLTYFEPCERAEATDLFMTSELAKKLSAIDNINVSNGSIKHLGSALTKHGFVRVKHQGRYKYAVKRKQEPTIKAADFTLGLVN